MRWIGLVLVIATLVAGSAATARAQSTNPYDLYKQGDLPAALDLAQAQLANAPGDRDLTHLVGRCLAELGRHGEAKPYLQAVVDGPGMKDWRYAWSLYHLATGQWWEEDRDGARATWITCRDTPALRDVKRSAANLLKFTGLAEEFAAWPVEVASHVHGRFSPALPEHERAAFMARCAAAWPALVEFFGADPGRSVDVIVWQDSTESAKLAGIPALDYTRPELAVVHTRLDQPPARELARVFLWWTTPNRAPIPFIVEGVAVHCDQTGHDRLAAARAALAGGVPLDIPAWWQDGGGTVRGDLLATVAGAFVTLLVEKGGREAFQRLLVEPTYAKAREIYGRDTLNAWVAEFTAAATAP